MDQYFYTLYTKCKDSFLIREYKSGDIIFNEGTPCEWIAFVLSGEVVITTITYNEKEETINVIKKNEVFGDFLAFSSSNLFIGDAVVKRKSIIAFIKKDVLENILKDTECLNLFLMHLTSKALKINLRAKLLSHKNIEDRIMYFLSTQGKDIIYIPSVTYLASVLSLPRPSVSRSLTKLVEKGLIKREKNYIYIIKNF